MMLKPMRRCRQPLSEYLQSKEKRKANKAQCVCQDILGRWSRTSKTGITVCLMDTLSVGDAINIWGCSGQCLIYQAKSTTEKHPRHPLTQNAFVVRLLVFVPFGTAWYMHARTSLVTHTRVHQVGIIYSSTTSKAAFTAQHFRKSVRQ